MKMNCFQLKLKNLGVSLQRVMYSHRTHKNRFILLNLGLLSIISLYTLRMFLLIFPWCYLGVLRIIMNNIIWKLLRILNIHCLVFLYSIILYNWKMPLHRWKLDFMIILYKLSWHNYWRMNSKDNVHCLVKLLLLNWHSLQKHLH